jgi:hypothetical protein
MRTSKGKIRFTVIKPALLVTPGMTGKTGNAVKLKTIRLLMFFSHKHLVMIMAIHTAEYCIFSRLLMAIGAIGPGICMFP